MRYSFLKQLFYTQEATNGEPLEGFVRFTEDSFREVCSEEARTYIFSSHNHAFMPIEDNDGSIIACALDGTDDNIFLDCYMADEHGSEESWKIECCGLVKYIVIKAVEREIYYRTFNSQEMAETEMLKDFSEASGVSLQSAIARFREVSQEPLEGEDNDFGFYENAVWFNGRENHDWKIARLLIE